MRTRCVPRAVIGLIHRPDQIFCLVLCWIVLLVAIGLALGDEAPEIFDMITGGATALGFFLTFFALTLQRWELGLQRRTLNLQIKEMAETRHVLKTQEEALRTSASAAEAQTIEMRNQLIVSRFHIFVNSFSDGLAFLFSSLRLTGTYVNRPTNSTRMMVLLDLCSPPGRYVDYEAESPGIDIERADYPERVCGALSTINGILRAFEKFGEDVGQETCIRMSHHDPIIHVSRLIEIGRALLVHWHDNIRGSRPHPEGVEALILGHGATLDELARRVVPFFHRDVAQMRPLS